MMMTEHSADFSAFAYIFACRKYSPGQWAGGPNDWAVYCVLWRSCGPEQKCTWHVLLERVLPGLSAQAKLPCMHLMQGLEFHVQA